MSYRHPLHQDPLNTLLGTLYDSTRHMLPGKADIHWCGLAECVVFFQVVLWRRYSTCWMQFCVALPSVESECWRQLHHLLYPAKSSFYQDLQRCLLLIGAMSDAGFLLIQE